MASFNNIRFNSVRVLKAAGGPSLPVRSLPVGKAPLQGVDLPPVRAAGTVAEVGEDHPLFEGGPVAGKYVGAGEKVFRGHVSQKAGVKPGEDLLGYRA